MKNILQKQAKIFGYVVRKKKLAGILIGVSKVVFSSKYR